MISLESRLPISYVLCNQAGLINRQWKEISFKIVKVTLFPLATHEIPPIPGGPAGVNKENE